MNEQINKWRYTVFKMTNLIAILCKEYVKS